MKTFIMAAVMLIVSSAAYATGSTGMEIVFPQSEKQAWCLAQNIYYEARGSSRADRIAVGEVVLNRVQDSRYPNTICEVVQQGPVDRKGLPIRNKCQFSWWCDGKSDYPLDRDSWAKAQYIAYSLLYTGQTYDITEGATHYHAEYVNPRWASSLTLTGRIGEHIFYRWK